VACEVGNDKDLDWTAEESWVDSQQEQEISHFTVSSIPILGCTEPPIQQILAVKQLGHEAVCSPPVSAKLQNECTCTSTSLYSFMVCIGALLSLPLHPDKRTKFYCFDKSSELLLF
jgi:hypothetical protein